MTMRAPPYPGQGNPCNGCGLCCAIEPCGIAALAGITEAPCAAMEFDGGRFYCGMVRHASRYMGTTPAGDRLLGKLFATMLGVGTGCDSDGPE